MLRYQMVRLYVKREYDSRASSDNARSRREETRRKVGLKAPRALGGLLKEQ